MCTCTVIGVHGSQQGEQQCARMHTCLAPCVVCVCVRARVCMCVCARARVHTHLHKPHALEWSHTPTHEHAFTHTHTAYPHRLKTENTEPYFERKKRLMPRATDLSFYNWETQMSTSNPTPNFQVCACPCAPACVWGGVRPCARMYECMQSCMLLHVWLSWDDWLSFHPPTYTGHRTHPRTHAHMHRSLLTTRQGCYSRTSVTARSLTWTHAQSLGITARAQNWRHQNTCKWCCMTT